MMKLLLSCLVIATLMGLSRACKGGKLMKSGNIPCSMKKSIVDTHNRLRAKVAIGSVRPQPAAENMLEMTWDEELARGAQKWANNCVFQHNTYSDRKVSRFQVGQNLAITWYSSDPGDDTPNFNKAINDWFNEVKNYTGTFTSGVGHYTQVVWSQSYVVGCGYSYFLKNKMYTKYYVCDYGPAGNVNRAFPYKKASKPACTNGIKSSTTHKGLCRPKEFKPVKC